MNKQPIVTIFLSFLLKLIRATITVSFRLPKIFQLKGQELRVYGGLFLCGFLLTLTLAACGGGHSGDITIKLVSFSVTKEAHDQIIPKFIEKWKQEHNQTVNFERSYGGSLAQTDDIIANKQEADVVHLAIPLDVVRLEDAGLVNSGWQTRVPRQGVVSHSVAAIVTREGNPKEIKSWADLAKPDVSLVSADPQTSGIGIWQFLGLWGSITQNDGEPEQAVDFVSKIYQHSPTLTKDAREASTQFFQQNKGDALVTYENEVILAGKNRPQPSYFVPSLNISIDNPVAVVDKNVDKHHTREVAEAFVDFLYSEPAQEEFAKLGYRSVNPFIAQATEVQFPPIEILFNAQDLGGWKLIQEKFLAKGGIFDQIRGNAAS